MSRSLRTVCFVAALSVLGPRVQGGDGAAGRLAEARRAHEAALERFERARLELLEAERAVASAGDRVIRTSEPDPGPADVGDGTDIGPPDETPGQFDWSGWTKSLTIGLNGASGNASFVTMLLTASLERETQRSRTRADARYRVTRRSDGARENRASIDLRHDRTLGDADRLRWWLKGTYEYDERRAWLHRLSGHAGLGYDMISRTNTTLGWRLGLGGTQSFDGPERGFDAEALLTGVDFTHEFGSGRSIRAGSELFMDLGDAEEIRVNSSLEYEVTLDAERGLLLRAGLDHRYEAEPEHADERHDVFYAVSLGWRF